MPYICVCPCVTDDDVNTHCQIARDKARGEGKVRRGITAEDGRRAIRSAAPMASVIDGVGSGTGSGSGSGRSARVPPSRGGAASSGRAVAVGGEAVPAKRGMR